jgi:Double-GTPase 2
MHELKITMLGPSGVGKTTLLTAMYEQFESNIGKTNLQLTPDEESAAILQEKLIELKTLMDSFEASGGIQGTEGEPDSLRSLSFGLGKKGSKPSLNLSFQDYPGGYHTAKTSPERREFVNKLLKDCVAVLIAVDAPALMEQNGKWHEMINRPSQMRDLFKNAYQELESPKLIIFAPVKCEKYLQDEASAKELLLRIKNGYANLIDLLNSESLRTKIATVVTPVQTVGSVVFSRIEMNGNNTPHFTFRKTSHDAEYSPKDSEQPLRYLLRFLLKIHLDQKSNSWGVFSFLRSWFGLDSHLQEAVTAFISGCKNNNGFAIIQGENLLKINGK